MKYVQLHVEAALRQGIEDIGLKASTYRFREFLIGVERHQIVHEFTARWERARRPTIATEFFIAEKPKTLCITSTVMANRCRGSNYERSLAERLEGIAKDLAIPHIEVCGDNYERARQQFWRGEGYSLKTDDNDKGTWVMEKVPQETPHVRQSMTFGHPVKRKNGIVLNGLL